MQPELDIGPLTLQTFGICFAVAFLFAGALVARRLTEIGEPADWSYELIFAAIVGGLLGARVDFLIQNWSEVSDDLLGSLFSGSGLVWLGGVVGGALGVCLWAWWRGFLGLRLLDLCAPGLALGYAIGRVGCQLSGDGDYGVESDLPWAMAYPEGTVPTEEEVHPTPVYETLAMGFAAFALWRLRDRFRPGILFALYLVIAGIERLLIEFIRRNDDVALGLTQAQLVSVVMTAAGVAWLIRTRGRGGLAAAPPAEAAARQLRGVEISHLDELEQSGGLRPLHSAPGGLITPSQCGRMKLGDETADVRAGDCVVIPPGMPHKLWAGDAAPLVLLCCCAPAYSDADTVITEA